MSNTFQGCTQKFVSLTWPRGALGAPRRAAKKQFEPLYIQAWPRQIAQNKSSFPQGFDQHISLQYHEDLLIPPSASGRDVPAAECRPT